MKSESSKIVAIVEARMTSSRLPGKVLLPAAGRPLLQHLVTRLQRVPSLDGIVIATTTNQTDDVLEALARRVGVGCFRGSELDVMARVLQAARSVNADVIVEITGDSPLIDPAVVEQGIQEYLTGEFDYVSNIFPLTYPSGMETQVFSVAVLAAEESMTHDDPAAREHVSLPIYEQPEKYRLGNFQPTEVLTWLPFEVTLDTPEDYRLIKEIIENLEPVNPHFSIHDIIQFVRDHPELLQINQHVLRKSAR